MICYIGLGANLGNRVKNLRAAIERIKKISDTKLLRVSNFYETAAWGLTDQPDFINAAIKIRTNLPPLKLLDELQKIERELGRKKLGHWSPRTIDLDILLIEGLEFSSDRLTVPHKFLRQRDFVLVPLSEIFPALNFQLNGDRVELISGSPKNFRLKFVACVDKNFGLGYGGKLLFKIPDDLKNFRRLTLNNTIIYGRKTLETFPEHRPLASRRNIILSQTAKNIPDTEIVPDVEKLFDVLSPSEKNFVVGGEKIFRELLPYAEEIYLTVVDSKKPADVFFPAIDKEFFLANTENFSTEINFEFRKYLRL